MSLRADAEEDEDEDDGGVAPKNPSIPPKKFPDRSVEVPFPLSLSLYKLEVVVEEEAGEEVIRAAMVSKDRGKMQVIFNTRPGPCSQTEKQFSGFFWGFGENDNVPAGIRQFGKSGAFDFL